ncbi:hypothetical protein [Modicisalibacter luteus]|uniref:hypothetical protein n=1 Tax=Modicisalibacter luteus TaxID=453962 RepID=UPI0036391096
MSDDRLRELADAAGLLVEWENSDGELCELSPDTQRILLGVLGFPADDDAAIEASLARLTQWRNPTEPAQWPPLITVDCDVPVTLPGPMPRGTAYVLTLEAGACSVAKWRRAIGCRPSARWAITTCRSPVSS